MHIFFFGMHIYSAYCIMNPSMSPSLLDIALMTPHPSHKIPPILGPGKITPTILVKWEEYARLFFTKDRTKPQAQVLAILSSFIHPSIKNWIVMNKDKLCHEQYSFDTFVHNLRKNFLDPQ
jgi:hypothetical protein